MLTRPFPSEGFWSSAGGMGVIYLGICSQLSLGPVPSSSLEEAGPAACCALSPYSKGSSHQTVSHHPEKEAEFSTGSGGSTMGLFGELC